MDATDTTDVNAILGWLERHGTRRNVEGMARYGIVARRAFGVSMGTMKPLAKRIGRNHVLALALWRTGWYEARLLAALVDDPRRVTRRQMDEWAAAFENWADCDTTCLHLFDRTPFAWAAVPRWSSSPREWVKRAGFALMAGLALHDKSAPDARFRTWLPLIERAAGDDRNFVKKAVNWALRAVGERSRALNTAALAVARRLARADDPTRRWIGRDALRQLARPAARARLARRARRRRQPA